MDLKRLEIDRSTRPARGRGLRLGRWIALALVVAVVWFFRAPLLGLVDAVRLPTVEVAAAVRVSRAAQAAVSGTAANGYVVARRRAALSADTPGRIVELNVEEGTVVEEGFVVARLYSDEAEAALRRAAADVESGHAAVRSALASVEAAARAADEARAGVETAAARRNEAASAVTLAERDHARVASLVESGVERRERLDQAESTLVQARARLEASESEHARAGKAVDSAVAAVDVAERARDEAQARIASLEAARDQAQATLDKMIVRAPFDGVVVLKDAEVGEVVSPNALGGQSRGSVATMVDFASLEIQVELPETSLGAVGVGQRADVFLDAFADERFSGSVLRIWPTANRQKATIELRVGLEEIDPRMRPDMGARVVFPADEAEPVAAETPVADTLLVPAGAVVQIDGSDGVFVVERDVVRFRQITLGQASGRRVAVEQGLDEGERVVVDPPARLGDGDRVLVKDGA